MANDSNTPIDPIQTPDQLYQERSKYFLTDLKDKCKAEDVPCAIVLVQDPKLPDTPLIYTRGHTYSAAKAAAFLAKLLKDKLIEGLES